MKSTDVGRLLAAFESGALVRPSAEVPNAVDLSRAVATLAGVSALDLTDNSKRIASEIGEADHYVFVLIDGLGVSFVETLPGDSFLRSHIELELQAVFPPTTAAAITSLTTGLWPAQHGVPSWWAYLPDRDVSATVLPFIERFTERPLSEFGVSASDVFTAPSMLREFRIDPACFMPAAIADSVYSRYVGGGVAANGYGTLADAVDAVLARVRESTEPTYTYLYYPDVDAVAHERGADDGAVFAQVAAVDQELGRLAEGIDGRARLIVTADHGLVSIPNHGRQILGPDDDLMHLLRAPPSGEPRAPIFHLRPGAAQEFEGQFRRRFGTWFVLLNASEVEELELLGPATLADVTKRRLGDYLALPLGADVLFYQPRDDGSMRGYHAGLTPAEMRIPLIVA